jgi:excisionase family DNA binding protein
VLGESSKDSQSVGIGRFGASGRLQTVQPIAPVSSSFAAPVLQGSRAPGGAGPVVVQPLLTVKEVAARLRVCRATVYELCKGGRLGHVRVGNSIRIPEPSCGNLTGKRDTACEGRPGACVEPGRPVE